jgi:hypothetical protein
MPWDSAGGIARTKFEQPFFVRHCGIQWNPTLLEFYCMTQRCWSHFFCRAGCGVSSKFLRFLLASSDTNPAPKTPTTKRTNTIFCWCDLVCLTPMLLPLVTWARGLCSLREYRSVGPDLKKCLTSNVYKLTMVCKLLQLASLFAAVAA